MHSIKWASTTASLHYKRDWCHRLDFNSYWISSGTFPASIVIVLIVKYMKFISLWLQSGHIRYSIFARIDPKSLWPSIILAGLLLGRFEWQHRLVCSQSIFPRENSDTIICQSRYCGRFSAKARRDDTCIQEDLCCTWNQRTVSRCYWEHSAGHAWQRCSTGDIRTDERVPEAAWFVFPECGCQLVCERSNCWQCYVHRHHTARHHSDAIVQSTVGRCRQREILQRRRWLFLEDLQDRRCCRTLQRFLAKLYTIGTAFDAGADVLRWSKELPRQIRVEVIMDTVQSTETL